jgi:hypothetical protein
MATLTSKLTLTSSDLTTNTLDLSTETTFTGSHTSGLARENITSTSKAVQLFINDGDGAVGDVSTREGTYIDITDNHGLRKRYVFTTADGSGVATGTIISHDTDTGGTTSPAAAIVGGTAVQIDDGDTENAILAKLVIGINHANGHNGSITAAAPATAANGPQSSTFTNPVSGESANFIIDNANATWADIHTSTNSMADHPVLIDKNKYTAPTIYYIKNTATYHATDGRVFLYYDNLSGEDVMELRGGQFVYMPGSNNSDLRAYTSTSGTVVEFMAIGTEA